MNQAECAVVLGVMQGAWRGRWSQEQEDFWLFELHSYTLDEAREAVRSLALEIDYQPSLHQFNEAVSLVRQRVNREVTERRSLRAARGMPERTAAMKQIADETKAEVARVRKLGAHNHFNGAANCLICGRHDHSDKTIFGWTAVSMKGLKATKDGDIVKAEHRIAVEAWRFICPACGVPDSAQEMCSTWSTEGSAFMRAQGAVVLAESEVF